MYSHPSWPRDEFFHMLSQYKKLDSYGKWLNNTDSVPASGSENWYALSIETKKVHKFCMAMENAAYRGYTSEKIISSLQAHTVLNLLGRPCRCRRYKPQRLYQLS